MHKIFANTLFIGKQVVSLPSCHSTNDVMAEMSAKKQLYEGAIVVTQHQTKGKGQRGNQWDSPKGQNLTFSIYLKPKYLKVAQQFELNRMSSLAVLDVIKRIVPEGKAYVKWPNDLILNRRKVAGILIENTINQAGISESVIGIGLNVNQKEGIMASATSMAVEGGRRLDLQAVLLEVSKRIEHYYLILKGGDFRLIHELYESNLFLKNRVAFYQDAEGSFNGIIRKVSAEGVLEIEDESNVFRKYRFKEVRLLSDK